MLLQNGSLLNQLPSRFAGGSTVQYLHVHEKSKNHARFGAITPGEAIPPGYNTGLALAMPQAGGGLLAGTGVFGTGELTGNVNFGSNFLCDITGTSTLDAALAVVVSVFADLTGSGALDASLAQTIALTADLAGQGDLLPAIGAIVFLAASFLGAGDIESTLSGKAGLLSDIKSFGELTPEGIRDAVWNALAVSNNKTGTMGELLNLAGSGGVSYPALAAAVWGKAIEAGFTAEQLLRIIAAQAAGAATGLESGNPQFTGVDGTTLRIDGTYSAGTRTIDSLNGD